MTGPLLPVRRLSHIGIKVSDLARSLAFYQRVLGFEVFLDQRGGVLAGHETVVGRIGDAAVELICDAHQPAGPPPDPDGLGISCLSFGVPDIDAAHAVLASEDLAIFPAPLTFPAARVAFFRDPDGNLLEVIEVPGADALVDLAR